MFKRATVKNGCPFNFVSSREYNASNVQWASSSATATFLGNRLDYGYSLQRRDLYAHYGCVNAIEFSNDGCFLVSGMYFIFTSLFLELNFFLIVRFIRNRICL